MRCSRCVFTDDIPGISFDSYGVCNFCYEHDEFDRRNSPKWLKETVSKIKHEGRKKRYDCVLGLSGGADSSYLLWWAVKSGLKPLAVGYNNGWDTDIAHHNVKVMVSGLQVDYREYSFSQAEHDDIWRAFLLSGVPDVEAVTDIAITTILYRAAEDVGTKYILNGHSYQTEGFLPPGLGYMDGKYIANVHKWFGKLPMREYPNLWLSDWLRWMLVGRIKRIRPFHHMVHNAAKAKQFLSERFGWKWYGETHLENKLTWFYKNYLRPIKFGLDSRVVEYAALVRSWQMNREWAIATLKNKPTVPQSLIDEIKDGLNISNVQFDSIMATPTRSHEDYETYQSTFRAMKPLFWLLCKMSMVPRTFYIKYVR